MKISSQYYYKYIFLFVLFLITSGNLYSQTCPTPAPPAGPSAPKGGGSGSGSEGSSDSEDEKKRNDNGHKDCDDDPYNNSGDDSRDGSYNGNGSGRDRGNDAEREDGGSASSNGSQNGDHGSGGFGFGDALGDQIADDFEWLLNIIRSHDPNEIISPPGYDSARFVSVNDNMGYTITYENDASLATAPAQIVKLYYPISPKQDMSTFRLGSFGFNNDVFDIPPGRSFYSTRLDLRDSLGIYVDLVAGIDVVNKRAFWIYESIDPLTGLPPTDPLVGMLPVSDTTTVLSDSASQKGNGYVNFYIKPISNALTRDTIFAEAKIVFDLNDTIPTNVEFNTIDAVAPVSSVSLLAKTGTTATLKFNGLDDTDGSGVRDYDLFLAQDSSNYVTYLSGASDSVITLSGVTGVTYYFFTLSTDNTGNREQLKNLPDLILVFDTTTVNPPLFTLNGDSISQLNLTVCAEDSVSECLQVMNSVGGNLTYTILENPTIGAVTLSPNVMGVCINYLPNVTTSSNDSILISVCDTAGGCDSLWVNVSINSLPVVSISPSASTTFCTGDSVSLDAGMHSSYLWSQGDTIQTITVNASGSYDVVVSNVNGCTSTSLPVTVLVNPPPSVTLNSFANVCDTVSSFALTGGLPLGGIYSGPGVVAGGFSPAAAGPGTHIITYVFVDSSGCSDSATSFINVIACGCLIPQMVSSILGPAGVCQGQTAVTFTVPADSNATYYIWTLPAGLTGTSNTNSIIASASGTYNTGNICVSALNFCGQSAIYCRPVSRLTVKPSKPSIISGSEFACVGSVEIYSVTPMNNATSFTWSIPAGSTILSGQGTNSIEVLFGVVAPGSKLSVVASNCIGTSAARTLNVFGTLGKPHPMTGSFPTLAVCGGNTYTYSIGNVLGASQYTWSAPVGCVISDGINSGNTIVTTSLTVQISFPAGFVVGVVSITPANGCGHGPSRNETVRSVTLAPQPIVGPKFAVCGLSQQIFSVLPVAGALSYEWTLPAGVTLVGPDSSNSIKVDFAPNFSNGNICVSVVNPCGSSSQRCIVVQGRPGPHTPISGPSLVCTSIPSYAYSVTPFAGALSYVWTVSNGGIVTGSTENATINFSNVISGNASITVRALNACGKSEKSSITVLVDNCRIKNSEIENSVSVFPNPATQLVTLYCNAIENTNMYVEMLDLTGRSINKFEPVYLKSGFNESNFNVEFYANGVYLLRIIIDDDVIEKKLIIQDSGKNN
jgi:hypothetical protein